MCSRSHLKRRKELVVLSVWTRNQFSRFSAESNLEEKKTIRRRDCSLCGLSWSSSTSGSSCTLTNHTFNLTRRSWTTHLAVQRAPLDSMCGGSPGSNKITLFPVQKVTESPNRLTYFRTFAPKNEFYDFYFLSKRNISNYIDGECVCE